MKNSHGLSSYMCPLCGNSEIEIIREFQSQDCLKHLGINFESPKFDAINIKLRSLWNQDRSYFLACKNCVLQFAIPFISGDNEFYNIIYDKNLDYPEWKWDFEIAYNILSNLIVDKPSTDHRLLEIGAGNGSFVKRISSNLIESKNIVTTEYSIFGRKKIQEMGVCCFPLNIVELLNEKNENSFDYICMFQVLEHLDNLDDVFKSLYKLMKPNGLLLIAVPNNLYRLQFEKLGIIEDVPPIHISRWNIESFRFVEQKYGLKILEHQYQTNSFMSIAINYLGTKYLRTKISKKLFKMKRGFVKGFMISIVYTFLAIYHLQQLSCFLFRKNMGISQLIHFKKV